MLTEAIRSLVHLINRFDYHMKLMNLVLAPKQKVYLRVWMEYND